MTEVLDSTQDFHYFTRDGETILLLELVRELQHDLEQRAVEADAGPLTELVKAMREATEGLASGVLQLQTPDALFDHLSVSLRRARVIVPASLVREVMREYMRTLERLNVMGVRYY